MVARNSPWLVALAGLSSAVSAWAQTDTVLPIAPDVYFHQGDNHFGHCNNGWIVLDDFVVEVDANYPSGAKVVIPKLKAITSKPIRFVVDTHFHPDHSAGNELWAQEGATIVAQAATVNELKKTGAAAWVLLALSRPDVAASKLKIPDIAYTDKMIFEDAHHRVELIWPGEAHTHGDTLVWLPKEKILFTGDLCVNGAYNYLHDSNVLAWIEVLETAKKLGAEKICPGHGPIGGPEILAGQQGYFIALQHGVQAMIDAGKTRKEIRAAAPALAQEIKKDASVARWVPSDIYFGAQVEKICSELTHTIIPVVGQSWALPLFGPKPLDLAWIPAGSFVMGSPVDEAGRASDEGPPIRVNLSQGYWLGTTFVTIGQWRDVMGRGVRDQLTQTIRDDTVYELDGKSQTLRDFMHWSRDADPVSYLGNEDDDLPMYFVSWNGAMEFAQKLTARERAAGRLPAGYEYNLPTEAQWEYACRAGTTTATYAGPADPATLDRIAWYDHDSALDYVGRPVGTTHFGPRLVAQKTPNAWGLFDMQGNLWQWCRDWYGPYPTHDVTDPLGADSGKGRVNRGGSFGSGASSERSARRASNPPPEASAYRGFRIALCPTSAN